MLKEKLVLKHLFDFLIGEVSSVKVHVVCEGMQILLGPMASSTSCLSEAILVHLQPEAQECSSEQSGRSFQASFAL